MSQLKELNDPGAEEPKNEEEPYLIYGLCLVIIAALLTLFALIVQARCAFSIPWGLVTLDGLVIFFLFAFFGFPMIFRFCCRMESVHRIVLMVTLAPFIAGHFLIIKRDYFPIMSWFIFTSTAETPLVTCREMIGIKADGHECRLLVEQIFPSIVQFDLPDDDLDGKRAANMGEIITAVGQEYNRLHPNSPVVRVDLREFAVPVRPTSPQDKPTWTSLESYPIISAPSKS